MTAPFKILGMKTQRDKLRDGHFALGLLVGAILGVGFVVWIAPRRSELRQQLKDALRTVRSATTEPVSDEASTC